MRGSGRSSRDELLEADRPVDERAGVATPTTITSSPIVFTIRASSGSVFSTASTKRSTASTASSSPSSSVRRV